MTFESINPYTGKVFGEVPHHSAAQVEGVLQRAAVAAPQWAATPLAARCDLLRRVAAQLRSDQLALAALITREMGKLMVESRAEIEKCAAGCDYYADHAPQMLVDELMPSDAARSLICYQPLGVVLAIMPWNFPVWQVLRCAIPALVGGNGVVLKHASNVPQCAQAIAALLLQAGLPEGVFQSLMIEAEGVARVVDDGRIAAVSFTGSEAVGRQVAARAGKGLKKCVLELGGSDPFVVLADADLDAAVEVALKSRFMNAGQSCIAAKRFIVVDAVADRFVEKFSDAVAGLKIGDPMDESTTLAPLARADLRDALQAQVEMTLPRGARVVTGGDIVAGSDCLYRPTLIDRVQPGMALFDQEVFGPVAAVTRVADEVEALQRANHTSYGLGGSVWTADIARGEAFARQIDAGAVFVNGLVKSDPRLPFGGIKASGYGRELARFGLHEFQNIKTLWLDGHADG